MLPNYPKNFYHRTAVYVILSRDGILFADKNITLVYALLKRSDLTDFNEGKKDKERSTLSMSIRATKYQIYSIHTSNTSSFFLSYESKRICLRAELQEARHLLQR